jgi:hypothetical protein
VVFWGAPYYYLPPDYSSDYVSAPPPEAYPGPEAGGPDPVTQNLMMQQSQLGQQIQQLSDQLATLRAQQRGANEGPSAPPQEQEPTHPIKLVLRNGTTVTVQNYALMKGIFWDFSATPIKRIPVSSVDVSASRRATEEAGGEFPEIVE